VNSGGVNRDKGRHGSGERVRPSVESEGICVVHVHERVSVKSFVGLMMMGNSRVESLRHTGHLKGALQLLIHRYGSIRFAQVPERVSTKSFVVLMIGNSRVESLRHTGHLDVNWVIRKATGSPREGAFRVTRGSTAIRALASVFYR